LRRVLRNVPVFEHPFLWETKAQVLGRLRDSGLVDGWDKTRSCSRNVRRTKQAEFEQCGLCSNCLYRRLSVMNARLESSADIQSYLWRDLNASNLAESRPASGSVIRPSKADREVAVYGAMTILEFATILASDGGPERVRRCANDIASAIGVSVNDANNRLRALIGQHALEWKCFLDSLGRTSWLRTLDGEVVQ
jgi:hypothetical protein